MSVFLPLALALAWGVSELVRHRRVRAALRAEWHGPRGFVAPVAVLTPVRGGDPALTEILAENLATLAGAGHECHWLVDEDDPAGCAAAEAAAARHPGLAARRILCPPCPAGLNPKLFKLERVWRELAPGVVLVLDDDACLPRASLEALVRALPDGELVVATALPAYRPGGNLASRLLEVFVNDNAAATYLAWCAHRPPITLNGMAWAVRVETLRTLDGFAPLLGHLTDDLAVANAVRARGGRIAQLGVPVWMRTELAGLAAFARQMHRWMLFARLLFEEQRPRTKLVLAWEQGLSGAWPLLALAALLVQPSLVAAACAVGGFLLQLVLRRDARRRAAGVAARWTPFASLAIALLQPAFLVWAACDRTIRWRDRRYRVHANTRFEPAQ